MASRYVSRPLADMLQAGGVTPAAVQRSIGRQVAKHRYPVLRSGHPYVRRIRAATGFHVTGIAWRYGRLLVSIEQLGNHRIDWFYEELKSTHCSFRHPAQMPDAVVVALRGRPMSVVTTAIPPLLNVRIAGADEDYARAGWLSLKLAPDWIAF